MDRLISTSKTLLIDIDHYYEGCAVFNDYRIYDSYKQRTEFSHGQYKLTIESPIISSDDVLYKAYEKAYELAGIVTLLLKCILGEAINTSPRYSNFFTLRALPVGEMPQGWTSNYEDVNDWLHKDDRLKVSIKGFFEHFFVMKDSPFEDLIKALEKYPSLPDHLKELLVITNDMDLVSDSSRYMLIGKGLEIVNAAYPYKRNRNKGDHRIRDYFPEIEPLFDGVTLEHLLFLSNKKRETRHYVVNRNSIDPHPEMTEEELKQYYYCSNLLCINVIRKALDLELLPIQFR